MSARPVWETGLTVLVMERVKKLTTCGARRYTIVILNETERSEESLVSKPMMLREVNGIFVKRIFFRLTTSFVVKSVVENLA